MAHAERLRDLPPGAQLLPDLHLAARGEGRSAIALHQRARPRQHPEGRHLLGDPAHVGRRDHADELRRIADVVDKYKIPTVKVTGGQRIDLLGVKKEDLPGVWNDLGMPSGHAYAKALRTVKTCVGCEWCRFGTQDSTQMGKDLERALWRMYAPHKVKLAVSRLPAQLRRIRHQGRRRDRRRFGLGDLRRRQRRHQDRGGAVLRQGEDPRRSARVRRRLPAAVPRGRLVPGAHRALRRRVGLDHVKKKMLDDATTARRCGSGCSSRSMASPIRGSSSTRRRSTRASSRR